MTSAVLDAALCLLLVSAAVVTVTEARASAKASAITTAEASESSARADETVELLTTVTETVTFRQRAATARNRTRRGTLAELLAFAAVRSTRFDDGWSASTVERARRGVRAVVERVLGPRTAVVTRWRPSPEDSYRGRFAVGGTPPRGETVHAARVTVPVWRWSGTNAGSRESSTEPTARAGTASITVRTWSA